MDNPKLGRAVLDVADFEPESFDMHTWGTQLECGTVACLAGHTLLLSGYHLNSSSEFQRPDFTYVQEVMREAEGLLGMTREESDPDGGHTSVWVDYGNGVERFRAIVEKAEKEG
jgi:hypothetical protein